MSEEIDLEAAKPVKEAKETMADEAVKFFKGEVMTPIHPKEITEEMCKRLYENLEEAKHLAHLIEMDKKDIKELAKEQTTLTCGKYIVMLTHKKGQRKVKWDKLAKDLIGKISEEDLAKYTDESEGSVSLSIRKVD